MSIGSIWEENYHNIGSELEVGSGSGPGSDSAWEDPW